MGETTVSKTQESNDEAPSEYLLDLTKNPTTQPAAAEPVQAQSPEDDIPEKYRGKSLQDIIEMHRNAESALGRAHNEVGQVRRLADELLGINRAATARPESQTEPARKPITPDDILSDPERAVVSVAKEAADQRVNASEERLARMEYELTLARFEQKHPGFRDTMDDQGFQEWVKKSPLRQRMAYAATQGDFAAADELFSLYGESGPSSGERSEQPTQQDAARKATLARSGGSTASRASGNQSGKPVWSREKLLEMRLNNPDEFERLQPQILAAYAEKRVR